MGDAVSAVGNMFGGGANNSSTTAQSANLQGGVTQAQLDTSYGNAQTGLQNQAALLAALQGQNGLQNQSNVFGQQQNLANALGMQAQGLGPNPAQDALNQATKANVANQASLMAGQRGAASNVGLMARQAGQQGAGIQQAAAGQSATMQAQQQIAAQAALANQQANMQNVAGGQIANQMNATTGYSQQAQNEQNMLLGANSAMNNALVSNQSNMNNNNMSMAMRNANTTDQVYGGMFNSLGGGAMSGMMGGGAKGGQVMAGKIAPPKGANPMFSDHKMPDHIMHVHKMFYGGRAHYDDGGDVAQDDVGKQAPAADLSTADDLKAPDDNVQVSAGGNDSNFTPTSGVQGGNISSGGGPTASAPVDLKGDFSPGSSSGGGGGGGGGGSGGMMSMLPMLAMMASGGGEISSFTPTAGIQAGSISSGGGPTASTPVDLSQSKDQKKKPQQQPGDKQPALSAPEGQMAGGAGDTDGGSMMGDTMMASRGGKVPALLSPGEGYLSPDKAKQAKAGANPVAMAKKVPGKPKVNKDSPKNDVVPATLETGGIVLPLSVMQADDPAMAAHEFVSKLSGKYGKGSEKDEFKVALKQAMGSRKGK